MALTTNFYLNNIEITSPLNKEELSIELNFDKDSPTAQVGTNDWEFGVGYKDSNDGAFVSNSFISKGLTGGVGVGEGLPFKIDLTQGGDTEELFKGYVDLWEANIQCNKITAKAVEQGGVDWANGRFDGVTFEYLYEALRNGEDGKIKDSDFVSVPYVISSIPNGLEVMMLILTGFVVVQTVKAEIQELTDMSLNTANPMTAITSVLQIALRVLYIATLLITLVKVIKDAVNLIIQPVKYHKGMYLLTLAQKGAEYFGLKFESTILDNAPFNKAIIIPQKNQQFDNDDGVFGFLKPDNKEDVGYYSSTYGGFLRMLKIKFNAKIIVRDGIIRLERRDYSTSTDLYELPPIERNGYTLNKEDFKSNLFIEYQTDLNDKNTIQEYEGTTIQVQTTFKKSLNKDMVLLSGFDRVSIPLSLGKVKTEFTVPEKILLGIAKALDPVVGELIKVVNTIIKGINKIIEAINKLIKALKTIGIKINFNPEPIKKIEYTPLADAIGNRLGMLKVENDWISSPKIILIDEKEDPINTKINSENQSVLNSLYLYNNFYIINSFDSAVNTGNANQYKKYEVESVPFCWEDYLKVKNDNKLKDGERVGFIDSLKWYVERQVADITFRVNELYSNNFTTKIINSKTGNPLV